MDQLESRTGLLTTAHGGVISVRQALRIASEADIVPVVRRMVEDARYYASLRAATASVALHGSTQRIVEEIAALLPAPLVSEDESAQLEMRSA